MRTGSFRGVRIIRMQGVFPRLLAFLKGLLLLRRQQIGQLLFLRDAKFPHLLHFFLWSERSIRADTCNLGFSFRLNGLALLEFGAGNPRLAPAGSAASRLIG